jgi:hypothetical protein
MIDIYKKLDDLLDEEVSTWPEDKRKHYIVSKGLVAMAAVPAGTDPSVSGLQALFRALEIGVEKEVNDAESAVSVAKAFSKIYEGLEELNLGVVNGNLDSGDISADLAGCVASILKSLIFEMGELS